MKSLSWLLLVAVSVTLLSGCKFLLPKSYHSGEQFFYSKEYSSAIAQYKQADSEKPDNKEIVSALLKANSYHAEQLYLQAEKLNPKDHDKRTDLLTDSFAHCRESAALFHKLLKLEPLKDKKSTVAVEQRMLPETMASFEYVDQVHIYSKTMPALAEKVASALKREKLKSKQINNAVKKAVALIKNSKNGPVKAHAAFSEYRVYTPYMADVARARDIIDMTLVRYYEAWGLKYIEHNRFQIAKDYFNKAMDIIPGNKYALAGILSISAKSNINKKNYHLAFSQLEKLNKIHDKSKFYRKYQESVRQLAVESSMTEASKKLTLGTAYGQQQAFDIYNKVKPIASPISALSKGVDVAVNKLRQSIALTLANRAKALHVADKTQYPALVAMMLDKSRKLHAASADSYVDIAEQAREQSGLNRRLQAILFVTPTAQVTVSGEQMDYWLDQEIHESIQEELDDNIHIVEKEVINRSFSDAEYLSSDLPAAETYETTLVLEIKKHHFKLTGQNRPEKKRSVYIAERYMVSNPAKTTARRELERAQVAYDESMQLADLARQECKDRASSLGGGLLGSIAADMGCNALVDTTHSHLTGLEEARNTFYSTPDEIEKVRKENYYYDEYTIKASGNIVASLIAYDARNKRKEKLASLEVNLDRQGIRRKKVKTDDVNNLTNGDDEVPDIIDVQARLESQLVDKVVKQSVAFLNSHYSNRLCLQAQNSSDNSSAEQVAEFYIQCSEGADKKQRHIAMKKAAEYIGYDYAFVKKYGENTNQGTVAQAANDAI